MLYKYFTEKILGLQGILIENIEEIDNTVHKLVKCAKAMQNWLTSILNSFTINHKRFYRRMQQQNQSP